LKYWIKSNESYCELACCDEAIMIQHLMPHSLFVQFMAQKIFLGLRKTFHARHISRVLSFLGGWGGVGGGGPIISCASFIRYYSSRSCKPIPKF